MKPKHMRAPVLIALAMLDGRVRPNGDGWDYKPRKMRYARMEPEWRMITNKKDLVYVLRQDEEQARCDERQRQRLAMQRAKLLRR